LPAVSVRARLLVASLLALAVGLAALVVAGNFLLRAGVRAQATSVLRARVEAELAAVQVVGDRITVRETPNDEQLDRRSWVLGRAALVLLVAFVATRGVLEGALRPVAQMTADAEDWGAHDLDRRFGLGPARDELTALAATLDGLLARIAASRRHEQRFAAEVAHELRTPIAGLRGRAELALAADGPGAEEERREALEAVVEDAARLNRVIETLVAVARREIDPSDGAVDLLLLARAIDGVA